jgi:recombination protein RecA
MSEFDDVVAEIRRSKGEMAIRPSSQIVPANHIPTGCFILDFALLGGIPEGFNTMIYGAESSGKTTLCKKIVGNFQKKHPDKKAVWVDPEGMFDPLWAKQLGVDVDSMHYASPESGNEAVDIIDALMSAWETGLVVVDSIPAMVPMAIIEKSAEDDTMTELARLMGKFCSKVLMNQAKERKRGHWVTLLLINQFRTKPGFVMGDPRYLPGGKQINHIPTTKIEVRNKEQLGKDRFDNEVVELNEHSFKITKHKHGASITSGEFQMIINPDNKLGLKQGDFDDTATVATFAKRMGLITGGGSSWKIEGVSKKFGKLDEIKQYLVSCPEDCLRLKQTLIAMQRKEKGLPLLPPDKYLLDWAEAEGE